MLQFYYSYAIGGIVTILLILFALSIAIPFIPFDMPRGESKHGTNTDKTSEIGKESQ